MRDRIKGTMASVFSVSPAAIPDDARMNEFPGWDSMRHLELMLALELEFGRRISTEAMTELLSLTLIEAYLSNQERAAGGG